jgi:spore maturation protein CgeB
LRLFETTGIGTCLLTDWKPNISELFEPVTYRSPAEALEKARGLLDHEPERQKIARAGQ